MEEEVAAVELAQRHAQIGGLAPVAHLHSRLRQVTRAWCCASIVLVVEVVLHLQGF